MNSRLLTYNLTIIIFCTRFAFASTDDNAKRPNQPSNLCSKVLKSVKSKKFYWRSAITFGIMVGGYVITEQAISEPYTLKTTNYTPEKLGQNSLHIALIGDSLSQDFHAASVPETIWTLRTTQISGNWFSDFDSSPNSVTSLFEQLKPNYPVRVSNFSRPMGRVRTHGSKSFIENNVGYIADMNDQIDQILSDSEFPNLILIWIGHNNADWLENFTPNSQVKDQNHRKNLVDSFIAEYRQQLGRLVKGAEEVDYPVIIVAYGLGNVKSATALRDKAEVLKRKNKDLYPYFDTISERFPCLLPQYREGTIEVISGINSGLHQLVNDLQTNHQQRVQIKYLSTFSDFQFNDLRMLDNMDAWHMSAYGHQALANEATRSIKPLLPLLIRQ